MKQLLLLVALVTIALTSTANNYYFSTSTGDDNRSFAQAQNAATPWKSIDKLNAIFNTLRDGDSVLLKRGESFYGKLVLSGYSTSPIVISGYGTGAKPVITGMTELTGWANFGGNRYEASLPNGKSAVNMVTFNGGVQAMGRYPNATAANGGYLTFNGHNGTQSITSSSVTSATSWTGADVVIRKTRWIIDRGIVTAQSGNTVYYNSPTGIQPEDGFGFFFENSYSTLDTDGEWYYNASNKKLDIYSNVNPATRIIKAATIDTLVYIYAKDRLTIDGISFEGSNVQTFQVNNCNNSTIKNCDINYSGLNGVMLFATNSFTFSNNTLANTNNNAFYAIAADNSTITGSTIRNTGLWAGMGKSDNQARMAMLTAGRNNLIQYNRFDSIGYVAIYMNGSDTKVLNNHISNFCLTTDDGGGIYASGEPNATGRIIKGNIVVNGRGNRYGTNQNQDLAANGIYMDDRSAGVTIEGNTVANCSENGIFLHNAHEITIKNNTVYNVNRQLSMAHDGIATGDPIRNVNTNGNIFVSKSASQLSMALYSRVSDIAQYGSIDNNTYYRPAAAASFQVTTNTESNYTQAEYTIDQIRSAYSFNRNSAEKYVNTTDEMLRLEYNGSNTSKTVSLGATYSDMAATTNMTEVTIAPYASVVLMKSAVQTPVVAKNKRPVAVAGNDQTISASTLTLSGAASLDTDGTIVSYSWTKISGPTQFNIVSPNQAVIAPKNLVAGTYAFRLKVIDNEGANSLDTVMVTIAATKANSENTNMTVAAETMAAPVAFIASAKAMNLYPNPTANTLNVNYTHIKTGKVKINIYDATGRIVESKDHNKDAASFTKAINVTALKTGSYYAEMRFEDGEHMIMGFVKN